MLRFGEDVWQPDPSAGEIITESDADAEDVVETFLKVCADGSGSRPDEAMRVRLATIAVREALVKRFHRGYAERENNLCKEVVIREIFVWGDNYRHHHSPEQTTDILEQAMWSLDPICRAVFVLRDLEEIPVEEAALVLNRSVPAVGAYLLRARLQLREQLARSFRPALPSIEETFLGDYPL